MYSGRFSRGAGSDPAAEAGGVQHRGMDVPTVAHQHLGPARQELRQVDGPEAGRRGVIATPFSASELK
ncbi:hypothetical protein M878_05580 [Streptomyces roseochromogenus subsp. oscitans DS 12.976]|uniref:Uncharacterized protein n=1 Tax=Streptomyces roseochromogenus subsp. oscitans DS 12.976 TaxID=1352936 RepID=V6KTR6_STRRC|nr:hypothetical protein M878_05580 [Streptomyces roseochromogenus subsp. oscitans DS 12.976]